MNVLTSARAPVLDNRCPINIDQTLLLLTLSGYLSVVVAYRFFLQPFSSNLWQVCVVRLNQLVCYCAAYSRYYRAIYCQTFWSRYFGLVVEHLLFTQAGWVRSGVSQGTGWGSEFFQGFSSPCYISVKQNNPERGKKSQDYRGQQG